MKHILRALAALTLILLALTGCALCAVKASLTKWENK